MAGLHFGWPKITGRMYPETLGRLAAVVLFIGFNLTFFPQFILGTLGMPRRYWSYPPEFQVLNVLSSAGATILAIGYLLPFLYLTWSLKYGEFACSNPWQAAGLSGRFHRRHQRKIFPGHRSSILKPTIMDELESPSKLLAENPAAFMLPIDYFILPLIANDFCHCSSKAG